MKKLLSALACFISSCSSVPVPRLVTFPDGRGGLMVPIEGKSMMPTIPEGAWVGIAYTPYKDLQVGDIVIFWDTWWFVIHRLTLKDRHGWRTKGDKNPISDRGYMTEEDYVCRFTGVKT